MAARKKKKIEPLVHDEDYTESFASYDDYAGEIVDVPITSYWEKYQFAYAVYTMSDRAIPSAYDGLKPVQRRLLYRMYLDKNLPGSKFRKSSAITSSVSGTLHPHGDVSVYGAATLLAAAYQRVRLIDGHGAFPRYQGDSPAASRYTEMRLDESGYQLVKELSESPVEMTSTFDNEMVEPVILPSRFPVLLVNGAVGMSEGYATKTPAHNPLEVLDLCTAVLDNPDITTDEVVQILTGPDWGIGCTAYGIEGIKSYIETGKGKVVLRGNATASNKEIVITSLPTGISRMMFEKEVRDLISSDELQGVSDLTDLTDRRNGMRVRVSIKRGHKPEDVLESLYTLTSLEINYHASIVALDNDKMPRWWSVIDLVKAFLSLRDSVVYYVAVSRKEKKETRLHLVEAMLRVQADVDTAVKIIRDSDTPDEASETLSKKFDLDEVQTSYVLRMPLRSLTKLDLQELVKEQKKLVSEIAHYTRLVNSDKARAKVVREDIAEVRKLFDTPEYARMTVINPDVPNTAAKAVGSDGDSDTHTISDKWMLDEQGIFGKVGTKLQGSLAWGVFDDGRVKITGGKGLPKPGRDVPFAPRMEGLVACGVLKESDNILLVTLRGRVIRRDPAYINPQGIAGNGVAGVKLADPEDRVVAAYAVTDDQMLYIKTGVGYKITPVMDIPVKGSGQGVFMTPPLKEDDYVIESAIGSKFTRLGKDVEATPRGKSLIRKDVDSIYPG